MVSGDDLTPVPGKGNVYRIQRDGDIVGMITRQHTGQGYNGHIGLWTAITTEGEIISVRVIDHQETPGIGDKIDRSVSDWIEGFAGQSLRNTNWATTKDGGNFDAITGATITSRATINAVHGALLDLESAQ